MKNLLPLDLKVSSHANKFGLVLEQKQSRQLKTDITNSVIETLKSVYDITTTQTLEGVYIIIPNDEEGSIIAMLDIKMKPLDTDLAALEQEYLDKVAERQEKAKKKATK